MINKFKELSTETINELLVAISHGFGYRDDNGIVVYDYRSYQDLHHELRSNYFFNKEFFKKEYPSFEKMSGAESLEIQNKYRQHCNPCLGMDIIYILLAELKKR